MNAPADRGRRADPIRQSGVRPHLAGRHRGRIRTPNGAIYRYFTGKDEIVTAICNQAGQAFPSELTRTAILEFLEHTRCLARMAALLPGRAQADAARIAEAFVALGVGYNQQVAVRGDLDPAPFANALMTIVDS